MSQRTEIMDITAKLVKSWEKADVSKVDEWVLPDAYIDFTMFGKDIGREVLKEKMTSRAPGVTYSHFILMNAMVEANEERAQETVSMLGTFAGTKDGTYSFYRFEGMFAISLKKVDGDWKMSAIRFELTDENSTAWPVLTSDGIPQNPGLGNPELVADWISPKHDDRIGWFQGSRVPVIVAEFDAPCYAIKDSTIVKSDEEQIEETFYKYALGIDFDSFRLYEDVFTKNARIIYGDTRPYDKRGVTMFLKRERAGSCRCIHTGVFDCIEVNGNEAEATLHLIGTYVPFDMEIREETVKDSWAWSRYRLRYKKEDNRWKIDQLNFYSGFVKLEEK